jgi:hypothetical protein
VARFKGTGEEVEEIDNILTTATRSSPHLCWYLRKFVTDNDSQRRNAHRLLAVPRKVWKDGKIVTNAQYYAKWAADIAASSKVGFVNLNEIIARKYEALGPEKVEALIR